MNREELNNVLSMCIAESNLKLHQELVGELSNVVWGNITGERTGQISFDEFYNTLSSYPAVYNCLQVKLVL